jgi:RNA polymerase sigma-70 factor (ECF subfamily)
LNRTGRNRARAKGSLEVAHIRSRLVAQIPRLHRYAQALTRDIIAADDLVQDCLERAVSKSHLWQEGTNLRAWLYLDPLVTSLNVHHSAPHVHQPGLEGTPMALTDIEPEPALTSAPNQDKRLELRDLERAPAKLSDEQRAALLLVGMEGMNYEQAAAVLDVPVGTIRSRVSRGRDALCQLMGRGIEQEETRPRLRRRVA